MYGASGDDEGGALSSDNNIVSIFLQSVGVVMSDIQDVVFK